MHWTEGIIRAGWPLAWALVAALAAAACDSGDAATTTTAAATACSGPQLTADDFARKPGPAVGTAAQVTPTIGEAAGAFALPDVQPLSCGYKAHYGLGPFVGKVTVVALLASW